MKPTTASGFTLVEVMLSMVFIAVALMATMGAMVSANQVNATTRARELATEGVRRVVEEIQARNYTLTTSGVTGVWEWYNSGAVPLHNYFDAPGLTVKTGALHVGTIACTYNGSATAGPVVADQSKAKLVFTISCEWINNASTNGGSAVGATNIITATYYHVQR
ncbi:MAG: hypothetical protein H0W83_07450 [Planctomycetes bacterium]|nr:hypothetical protein [Planctomycetota bacterium]